MNTPSALAMKVRVAGLRPLKKVGLDLHPINVFIGPDGTGKSKLLSAFRLVAPMRPQSLLPVVGEEGRGTVNDGLNTDLSERLARVTPSDERAAQ